MAHFAKPAEGSWTQHYPELGTGVVSYEDSISPEHYELERQAIFARESGRPMFWAVIHEGVLRHIVGSPGIMRGQLDRLEEQLAAS